jgi:hypothetical protein
MPDDQSLAPIHRVEGMIPTIRGQRVMLDSDLAALYGVSAKALNQAVKRNRHRFPEDFMFRLTKAEKQEVVTICDHLQGLKFSPVLPFAFTEHGAIMAANVLNSERAVQAGVHVVRAFVKVREVLASHKEMSQKLSELERRLDSGQEFGGGDTLVSPPPPPSHRRQECLRHLSHYRSPAPALPPNRLPLRGKGEGEEGREEADKIMN